MPIADKWDTGLFGADWDSGLEWDLTTGPGLGDLGPYLALVASQHKDKPKFIGVLSGLLQPVTDIMALLRSMPDKFDLDVAVGVQLDVVGQWIGVTRNITVPLQNVYFALDQAGVGLNQGSLQGQFDPSTGLLSLPDDAYRTLLRARIASNHWDGTIPGAYQSWDRLFAGTGISVLIQDGGKMDMIYGMTGPVLDAVTIALFVGGYLSLRPAGVRISSFLTPSVANAPYFGIGVQSAAIGGLSSGAFGYSSAGI